MVADMVAWAVSNRQAFCRLTKYGNQAGFLQLLRFCGICTPSGSDQTGIVRQHLCAVSTGPACKQTQYQHQCDSMNVLVETSDTQAGTVGYTGLLSSCNRDGQGCH